jgi:hypothetical protein
MPDFAGAANVDVGPVGDYALKVRARLACVLLVLTFGCRRQPPAGPETQEPTPPTTADSAACIRQQDGCVLCVTRRVLPEVEDRPTRVCNPRRPSECVEFCTTLTAECATPWHSGPACLTQTEDDFRRRQFWLEAADRPEVDLVARVVDEAGKKLESARVQLADGGTVVAEATSGRDGGVRILLRAGSYLVRVARPGQATLLESVRLAPEKTSPLRVFRMEPEQRISGRVVDEGQVPVAGATVIALRSATELLPVAEVQAAADGVFALRGLDLHRYLLRVVAFGYRASETSRVQAPAKGVTLTMMRTHVIRGVVQSADSVPQPEARILVVPTGTADGTAVLGTTSGVDGRYALDGFTPGGYLVWASKGDRATYPPMRVTLEPDDPEPLDLDLKLDHVGSVVTGAVVDAGDHPVGGARVELQPLWPLALPVPLSADTGRDGHFAVDGLTPGRYEMSVRLGARQVPLMAGPRDVQVPIEGGEEIELDGPLRVRIKVE